MLIVPLLALPSQTAAPQPIESLPPLVEDAQAMSPDHERIAISTESEGVWVLDIATKLVVARVPPGPEPVKRITWKRDGSAFAVLHQDEVIEVVDARTGEVRTQMRPSNRNLVRWNLREIHFAAGDSVIVVALGGCPTDFYPAAGGERIARIFASEGSTATALAISSDGETLALGDGACRIGVWNARTGEALPHQVTVPTAKIRHEVRALAFDPQGKVLAIGGGGCTVKLWEFETDRPLREFSHCDADMWGDLAISDVEFNRDGSRLLVASWSYWEARVWDVASGKILDHWDFSGGNSSPMRAWFASNDQYLVFSIGCRFVKLAPSKPLTSAELAGHLKAVPGKFPTHDEWAWWKHDGDYAWALVANQLVVRKIPDEQPLLKLAVREN